MGDEGKDEGKRPLRAGRVCPQGTGSGLKLAAETNRSRREGSTVCVHDRLAVVVGKRVIQALFDDPVSWFGWRPGRKDSHTLFPQTEMAQDPLYHRLVVDECDNPHLTRTFRAEKWIGLPDLLDPFPPLHGGNAVGFMLGDVDDLQGIAPAWASSSARLS